MMYMESWAIVRKEYTVDNFRMDNIDARTIGWWNGFHGTFDVNTSSILTRLIQEAGRWCENYASDLFIDWVAIMGNFTDANFKGGSFLFGFRKDGVDNTSSILTRFNNGESNKYRAIWRLDIKVESDEITMILGRVD